MAIADRKKCARANDKNYVGVHISTLANTTFVLCIYVFNNFTYYFSFSFRLLV